jgi:hypothetical protein
MVFIWKQFKNPALLSAMLFEVALHLSGVGNLPHFPGLVSVARSTCSSIMYAARNM